jgi:N-acetylornithine carbamoyltransferase
VIAHFLDGTEPGRDGFLALVQRALELRAGAPAIRFPNQRLTSVFLNPSLRTRTSLDAACHELRVHHSSLSPGTDAWKMEHRPGVVMDGDAAEHLADAVPVLNEYADLLAVRAFAGLEDADEDRADPVLSAFVRYSRKPVINLESARFHPLQGLADAATWQAHLGEVRGQPITLTWAPHPKALPAAVPNQVMLTAALVGADLTIAHPDGFDLDPRLVERAQGLAREAGGGVRFTEDPDAAMRGARVVIAKSWSGWSGYGRREDEARVRSTLGRWTLDGRRFALAREDAGFMHCLPVRRNVVVADEVIDGPRSWTTETGGLRMWTAMALVEHLLGGAGWTA